MKIINIRWLWHECSRDTIRHAETFQLPTPSPSPPKKYNRQSALERKHGVHHKISVGL